MSFPIWSTDSRSGAEVKGAGGSSMSRFYTFAAFGRRALPNHWDVVAFAAVIAVLAAIARAYHGIAAPLPPTGQSVVSLDYAMLP